jgi:three-Cys-motif partner protein
VPDDREIERRRQTQHKLEVMQQYWGAYCTILARAGNAYFCSRHIWLIDTHAARGLHASAGDPDGFVAGTPLQAVLAARGVQELFPDMVAHVRASDSDRELAGQLERLLARYRGAPPAGVDLRVRAADWITGIPEITAEILADDHPYLGSAGWARQHQHRSLWFIDPHGPMSLDHEAIAGLPSGAEVIINLDVQGLVREIGLAERDVLAELRLERVFNGNEWRLASHGPTGRQQLADMYANSFPSSKWPHRAAYPLKQTGSQFRALVHLTRTPTAVKAFKGAVKRGLKVGTVAAGSTLSASEKHREAVNLFERFKGRTLTVDEMRGLGGTWLSIVQLKVVCRGAEPLGYGDWDEGTRTMTWYPERTPDPTLFG